MFQADTYGDKEINEDVLKARIGAKLKFDKPPPYVEPKVLKKLAAAPITKPDEERDRLGLLVNFTWADGKSTKCPIRHIRDQSNCGSCWVIF